MYPRGPACPVCGVEVTGPPAAPCPVLRAAGRRPGRLGRWAGSAPRWTQLTRDRDELLATLRAAAPGPAPRPGRRPDRPCRGPPPPAAATVPRRRRTPRRPPRHRHAGG